jgi:plastocyanin
MVRRAGLSALIALLLATSSVSAATATVKMANYYFSPKKQTVALGNSVQWKNVSGKKHSATPVVNWSWGGVTVAASATSAAVSPTQAGTFKYFCSFHPGLMTGKIKVPMTVEPAAGTTATWFTFTLGTVTTPGVSVHQVEVRRNGGAWTLRATTAQTTTTFFFTEPGTWDVRTRLRWQLGGATSGWSPLSTVVVF